MPWHRHCDFGLNQMKLYLYLSHICHTEYNSSTTIFCVSVVCVSECIYSLVSVHSQCNIVSMQIVRVTIHLTIYLSYGLEVEAISEPVGPRADAIPFAGQ